MLDKLARLAILKDKMVNEKDLSKIMTYFTDELGEDKEFLKLGKRVRHELINILVTQTAGQMFKKKNVQVQLAMHHMAEQHFLHGPGLIEDKMALILYFEDIKTGLIGIVPTPESNPAIPIPDQMIYMRIAATIFFDEPNARFN